MAISTLLIKLYDGYIFGIFNTLSEFDSTHNGIQAGGIAKTRQPAALATPIAMLIFRFLLHEAVTFH